MSRAITAILQSALNAPSTGKRLFALLTLAHSSFGTKRLVSDVVDQVSRGNTYAAHAFTGELPRDHDGPGQATFLLDATDKAFAAALRAARGAIDVTLEAVRMDDLETVEASAVYQARARDFDEEAAVLQLDCAHEPVQDEAFPGPTYDPQRAPDLFVEPE